MKPNLRNVFGVLRLLAAASLASSIIWQVSDRLANNNFRPTEYFAFFSIQGSIIAAVTLAVGGYLALNNKVESVTLQRLRLSVVTYVIIISVVYNALLRGVEVKPGEVDYGYVWPVLPNEIIHVWAPIFILLDFALMSMVNKPRLRAIFWVLIYPLAWLGFSIVRGLMTDWWPYWFLNPNDPAGVTGVVAYIFGIMFFMLAAASASLGLNKLLASKAKG